MTDSLFESIGGTTTLHRAVTMLYDRILTDPALSPAFAYVDIARVRGHMKSFLAVALGGPTVYDGKGLAEAHSRLRITDDMFDGVIGHLVETLETLDVDPDAVDVVITRLAPLRSEVVNAPRRFGIV